MLNPTNTSLLNLLKRLWPHITDKRRKQFSVLFLLMIVCSLAEMISIGAILPFLAVLTAPERLFEVGFVRAVAQYANITDPQSLLLPLTILFSAAAVTSGGLRLLLLWAQTRISHSVGADLSISIYRRSLYQPYMVQISRNSSELIAGISGKASNVVHCAIVPVLVLASSFLMLIAIISTLIALQPTVALAAFVGFGAIYGCVIFFVKKRLKREGDRLNESSAQVIKALQEGLGGIRDVLLDGTQNVYCDIYKKADLSFRASQANISIISNSPRFAIEALGIVLIAFLAYALASRAEGVAGAVPLLGALALGAQRLLPILQQSYSSWSGMKGGQALLEDAITLLEQPLPAHADEIAPKQIQFDKQIVLNTVSFRYPTQNKNVLEGISFAIPKGARVGIIGSTGSGKSTILDVLMGLLIPTEGELCIDNQAITASNYRSWQAHIAHVPQVIFLADTSVAANIAFGVPLDQIDIERVRLSARQAQLATSIESWPDGYNTMVGERGVRLSGGQRQRIGIARALYKKADVIIFDEATSSLDNETEASVMSALEALSTDLTIISVAHRITTLQNCSQIIEIDNGRVQRITKYADIVKTTESHSKI
jgi:ABC-type multidrug transport system fused ATPase/permease subunit